MSIIKQLGFPSLKTEPIGYRQAYSAALPATDPPASILFLQCSPEESESELIEFEVDGKSTVREIECDCLSVRHPTGEDLSAAAQKLMLALVNPLVDPAPARIVILGPPSALAEAVRGALSTVYPSIPIHLASFADLSSGAAKFLLPDPDAYPRTRRTAMYIMPLPVSIATADGGAVVAVPDNRKIRPVEESILLTTSVDNQTSATVRIFLGDHARADDNLACGSVVLKGLNPMQRGEALVRVTFVIAYAAGATVTVEQVIDGESGPGPSKIAQFPDLIRYLGTDYERYAVGRGQHPAVFVEDSAGPVGELPA
jgi:hypothetical protein